jgi:guanine deaminase
VLLRQCDGAVIIRAVNATGTAPRLRDADYMRLAVEKTRTGIAAGQTPFGAVVVLDGTIIAAAHNTVWRDCDPSAHAEVNAIREAALALGRIDLAGCVMYTTCEPCPMCLSAIHWSQISRVVYGATISDAAAAGFRELRVRAETLAQMGGSKLQVQAGPLRDECRALFLLWKETGKSGTY